MINQKIFNKRALVEQMYETHEVENLPPDTVGVSKMGSLLYGNITILNVCHGPGCVIGCWENIDIALQYVMDWFDMTQTEIIKISKNPNDNSPHVYLHTNYGHGKEEVTFLLSSKPINQLQNNLVVI